VQDDLAHDDERHVVDLGARRQEVAAPEARPPLVDADGPHASEVIGGTPPHRAALPTL